MQTFELVEKKIVASSACYTVSEYLYNKYKETCLSHIQEIIFTVNNVTLKTEVIQSLIELSKKEPIFHIYNQKYRSALRVVRFMCFRDHNP